MDRQVRTPRRPGRWAAATAPALLAAGGLAVLVAGPAAAVTVAPGGGSGPTSTTLSVTSSPVLAETPGGESVTAVLSTTSGPSGGQPVTFTIGAPGGSTSETVTTDPSGTATVDLPPSAGAYPVTVSFAASGSLGSSTVDQTVLVYQPTDFVVWGGGSVPAAGTDLQFWGAQWASQITTGAPAGTESFKGYADQAGNGTFAARPGNSSKPPASIGSYVGVLVADTIGKSGSTISGTYAHVLVVQVDDPASYAPNPGHPATGVVVAAAS